MAFIAPVIAAIGGAIGAAGIAGQILLGALSIGASIVIGQLTKKKTTSSGPSGNQSEVKFGGDIPRQIIFGTAATAGHQVYINSYGTSNSHEEEVYVLSDWECDSLVGIIVDGEEKTLVSKPTLYGEHARFWVNDKDNGNSDTTDDANHYGSKLEIRFYRGAASQTADAGLIANSGGRWTTDHRGDGVCYVVVDKTYDADLFSGFPTFKFVVKGAKLYDWRKDSTVGGSGSHRWATPSTWEHSGNPVVGLYNYQRGFYRNGSILIGEGVPASDLPLDLYTTAANVCDEAVELAEGGTEARYAVSAIATDDTQHKDIMDAFVGAMGGYLYEQGGVFLPVAGAARTVSTTITDDDLLLDGTVKVTRKRSRAELINYVSGTFTSPADLWESKGYTAISSTTNEEADGERLGTTIDFPFVTSQARAERLAKIKYNESRCQTQASIFLSIKHIGIEVGDWIRWNSARYGDRNYRVRSWSLSLTGGEIGIQVGLSEINSAVFGWNPLVDEGPQIETGVPRSDAYQTRTVSGFSISPTTVTASTGEAMPAASVLWTPPADQTVTAVIIEYRRVGSSSASTVRSDSPDDGALTITGLLGGADYEARATIVTDPPRATSWTSWEPFSTEAGSLAASAVDFAHLVPSLSAQVDSVASTVDAIRATMLREQLARVGDRARAWSIGARVQTTVTEQWTASVSALASRVDSVEAAITDDIGAAITEEATARANADGALADLIATVEATANGAAAAVATETTARTDADSALAADIGASVSALASRVDSVEAAITDDIGAAITEEATARANADGALADLIATVEATANGAAAAVATETTARTDADSALAADIEALSATVGDASASGGIKFALAADQTGALARYELWLKATSGTFSATAALTLEVIASGGTNYSQIKFKAGRFLVMGDDGTSVVPFSVVGGTTYIDSLQVRHTINIGQSGSGGEIIIWGP